MAARPGSSGPPCLPWARPRHWPPRWATWWSWRPARASRSRGTTARTGRGRCRPPRDRPAASATGEGPKRARASPFRRIPPCTRSGSPPTAARPGSRQQSRAAAAADRTAEAARAEAAGARATGGWGNWRLGSAEAAGAEAAGAEAAGRRGPDDRGGWRLAGLAAGGGRLVLAEVTCRYPEPAQQPGDLIELPGVIAAHPELRRHQVLGRALYQDAALRRNLGQGAAAIPRVRPADDKPLPFQPLDDVGDAGRVHHQPLADQPQRQCAFAAERDQDQRLIPREGQPVRPQLPVKLGEQDLLRPHDRSGGRHGARIPEPALPDLRGSHDRVKRQIQRFSHSHTVPPPGVITPGPRARMVTQRN